MVNFVLKNNLFEFNCKFHQQISDMAIGTKFAPPYACIFMDYIETELLKTQAIKPWYAKDSLMISYLYLDIFRVKFKQVPKGS